ncbi:MAG: hypothetical protein AB1758_26655 [Candidatus Eremiobacterota bacterium]
MDPMSFFPNQNPFLFSAMDSMPNMGGLVQSVLAQNLNSQQLVQGIITGQGLPSNMFAGLENFAGLATPRPPRFEMFQAYSQMQTQFQQEEQSAATGLVNNINSLHDSLFTTQHYEFGADGTPTLTEGAETFDQRLQRLEWEKVQERTARESFAAEKAALQARVNEIMQSGRYDMAALEQIQKAETELNIRTEVAALMSKLPPGSDTADPTTAQRRLYEFAQSGLNDFFDLRRRNEAILNNSEAGRAVREFIEETRRYLASLPPRPAGFDPNALRNFGRNQGLI